VYRQVINPQETHGCFTSLVENQRLTILRRRWEDNIKVDTILRKLDVTGFSISSVLVATVALIF
jgi:hypothetical protein